MNTLEQVREGQKYTLNWQITPQGRFQFFVEEENTMNGQPVKTPIRELKMEFDVDGWLVGIHTQYVRYALDNDGNVIDPNKQNATYHQPLPMTSNAPDMANFVLGFAGPLFPSIANGLFRSGYGFNYTPPFNSQTGAVIQYTPEQLAAPPSRDYYTHHADGTPINPTPVNDDEAQ